MSFGFPKHNESMVRHRNLIEALEAAPAERPFLTFWVNEEEQETVTFGEFCRRARVQSAVLHGQGVIAGDRVMIIMPQGIAAMTVFAVSDDDGRSAGISRLSE